VSGRLCVRLSAVEINSVSGRQMTQLVERLLMNWYAFEGEFQTSLSLFLYYKYARVIKLFYHFCESKKSE
jgi:hypothetical protein